MFPPLFIVYLLILLFLDIILWNDVTETTGRGWGGQDGRSFRDHVKMFEKYTRKVEFCMSLLH